VSVLLVGMALTRRLQALQGGASRASLVLVSVDTHASSVLAVLVGGVLGGGSSLPTAGHMGHLVRSHICVYVVVRSTSAVRSGMGDCELHTYMPVGRAGTIHTYICLSFLL